MAGASILRTLNRTRVAKQRSLHVTTAACFYPLYLLTAEFTNLTPTSSHPSIFVYRDPPVYIYKYILVEFEILKSLNIYWRPDYFQNCQSLNIYWFKYILADPCNARL